MFASICKHKIKDKQINDINLRRNQVMHSYWVKEESTENISRIKIKAD
jgi:hypothetical protein